MTLRMTSTIYYFSSTGNSLQIARIIAGKIGDCLLKPMSTIATEKSVGGKGKSIGFVFPVFNFGMPRLVKYFVESLIIMQDTYCFAYLTYGGFPANTYGMLEDILAEKGIYLSYAGGVNMPKSNESAPPPEKVKKLIDKAVIKADKAAIDISNKIEQPIKRKAKLLTKYANNLLYKNIEEYDKHFEVTQNKCASCGLCVKICPVNNIEIRNHYPIWLHNCERCLSCFQWCPNEAIYYGKKTINWRRYHNPSIKEKDLLKIHEY